MFVLVGQFESWHITISSSLVAIAEFRNYNLDAFGGFVKSVHDFHVVVSFHAFA